MKNVQCFFIEPVGRSNVYFRRVNRDQKAKPCRLYGIHDAMTFVGHISHPAGKLRLDRREVSGKYLDDPRWPSTCDCGYEFSPMEPNDVDEIFLDPIYQHSINRSKKGLYEWLTIEGCMWDSFVDTGFSGPDGLGLSVVRPGGNIWHIDETYVLCRSKNVEGHKCWKRTGAPPHITVTANCLYSLSNLEPSGGCTLTRGVLTGYAEPKGKLGL